MDFGFFDVDALAHLPDLHGVYVLLVDILSGIIISTQILFLPPVGEDFQARR